MGKYIWEMLHTISQSWNITRKFYNEETWPTHWKMKPIFFSQSKCYIHVFHRTLCPGTGTGLLDSGFCMLLAPDPAPPPPL